MAENDIVELLRIVGELEDAPLAELKKYEDELCSAYQTLGQAYNRWLNDDELDETEDAA